ncbi:hypothetical protein KSP40_PGU018061 [Platanthera guangdongensis]|uniref:Uncharacterized protein n=1 Tax=Platanthera guangdongensis TaxID=2320717 RepID=A0ABR2LC95_9ASPA
MAHSHSSEDEDSSSKAFSPSSRDENLAVTDPESPNTAQQSSDESASSDGVLVELPGNNDQDSRSLPGDPETGILVNIDGSVQEQQERDDLFLDASDHMGSGGGTPRLDAMVSPRRRGSREQDLEANRARFDAAAAECRKFKEERDAFGTEVVALRAELQGLIRLLENREIEHADLGSPTPLHSMVTDCSNFVVHLKGILDERCNSEGAVLFSKDQEIEFLNVKISEDDVFRDVLTSYIGSVWRESSQSVQEYKNLIERRLLSSLPVLDGTGIVPLEELFVDGISLIERRIMLLVEKQNKLLIEIEQLGLFMQEIVMPGSLTAQQNEPVLVFHAVREELLGGKKKKDELEEKIRVLEDENLKMSEQITNLNKAKDEADSEMSRVKTELEQAESRFSASKEKLSIAVTKGKQLIQHRDSLKQTLTEKTTELDKCVYELKQKANALETMEASNGDLQQVLSVKTSELEKCLLELQDKSDAAEDSQKLLQERTSELEKCLQELQLKSDAFDNANTKAEEVGKLLAENKDQLENCLLALQQKSREMETTVANAEELKQSFIEKSCELDKCVVSLKQNSDAFGIVEANVQQLKQALSEKEIELEKSLLELQEKSDFMVTTLKEFNDLKDIVTSLQDLAAYRDKVLKEIEGITHDVDFPKEVYSLDIVDKFRWLVTKMNMSDDTLRENRRVKDALHSVGVPQDIAPAKLDSQVDWLVASFTQTKEELSRLQSEVTHTSTLHDSEVSEALKEYDSLAESLLKEKKEKESLLIEYEDLKVSHEMLAEKLALIFSEKENFIQFLKEICATSFDDQPTHNMDTILDKFTYLRKKLMTSLNNGKILENMQSFLHVTHVERILFEKILEDNETKLISLSNELGVASAEINAFRNEKEFMQTEIERLEDRNSLLKDKLSMAVKKGKGLVQEREVFKLTLDEKKTEIERLKEELQLQESKVCEYMEQIKFLSAYPEQLLKLEVDIALLKDQKEQNEHLLSERNDNLQKFSDLMNNIVLHTDKVFESPVDKIYWIAGHISEIEDTKNYLAHELEKAQHDANLNSSRYAETLETLKSLEIKLETKEKHIHDEMNNIQFTQAKTEEMLEKAREECFTQANMLAIAHSTIKSLEDKLSLAEDRVFALVAEKNEVVSKSILEISALNKKIAECNEELRKTHSSSESQLIEILSELRQLETFMKNEGPFLLMIEQFRKNSEGLRHIWTLIQDIHEKFRAKMDPYILSKVELVLSNLSSPTNFEDLTKFEIVHTEAILDDVGAVISFKRIAEKIKKEARSLNDRFTDLSKHMDDFITFTLQVLEASRDEFIHTLHLSESLKHNLKKLEEHNQAQESEIYSSQIRALKLLSKCNSAIEELQVKISELSGFDSGLENIQPGLDLRSSASFHGKAENEDVCEFDLAAENLLLTSRKVITQYQNLVNINKEMSISFENLKLELNHAKMTADDTFDENKVIKEKILKLEGDMEALQNIYNEMKAKLNDYKSKEDKIKDTETKLERLDHSLTAKDREVGDEIISRGQIEVLLEKVDKLILMAGSSHHSGSQSQEVYFTSSVNKLFYVVDKFSEFLQEVVSLADEKKDLQLIIAGHVREIENLKSFAEYHTTEFQDLQSKKWQLNEVTSILEKITQKLAEHYSFEDLKPVTAVGLIQVLERQMIALWLDLENSKSQIHELGGKLHAKDIFVNELSSKVKYLEDSHARIQQPNVKERTVFESSSTTMRPEITEIEEGSVGMSSKSPIASAHVRAMRKGSSDHLALTVDSEYEHLLTAQETEDKGHVFKSLNTSGLIPKQGRLIADRVDGIWVSGGRMLMSKPAARLGLIAYCIFLHLWALVSIL